MSRLKKSALYHLVDFNKEVFLDKIHTRSFDFNWTYSWLLIVGLALIICVHTSLFF